MTVVLNIYITAALEATNVQLGFIFLSLSEVVWIFLC